MTNKTYYYIASFSLIALVMLSFYLGINEKQNNSQQNAKLWAKISDLENRIESLSKVSKIEQNVAVNVGTASIPVIKSEKVTDPVTIESAEILVSAIRNRQEQNKCHTAIQSSWLVMEP